jgi:hypothetical protein
MKQLRAILFLLLLSVSTAQAADITLSWTNATRNDDATTENPEGTLIPTDPADPDALKETEIFWSICTPEDTVTITEGLDTTIPTTVPGQAESTQIVITTPGRWCFVGVHRNNSDQQSRLSNVAFRTVFNVPMPPQNLTVNSITVYYVIQRKNRFALLPVGTIPIGTACSSTEYVNGYFAVDRDLVEWSSGTQPLVVVAQCG